MPRKKTKEEFIEDSIKVHGDNYNYSLVKYKNNKTKVKIICKEHGVFEQLPLSHTKGNGCIKCCNNNQTKNIDIFIKESNIIHNKKYDYSLVNYINSKTKVKIVCPEHGVFEQRPLSHINGNGCSKCVILSKRHNKNIFISKSHLIHNNKYDYSLVKYKNTRTKVKIICPEHGIFEQLPSSHINGNGCSKCFGYKYTYNFIRQSNIIHNNKYNYKLVDYINAKTKVKIICPEHGIFEQLPSSHINQKQGCPKCSGKYMDNSEFIKKSNKIHHNKYDYSLVKYKKSKSKVKIICQKHGLFIQRPNDHLQGFGCPSCNDSKGEREIKKILTYYNVKYLFQKSFTNCKYKKCLRFDFYLPDYNMCIEFDGKQHFEPIEYFGGILSLKEIQKKDKIKNNYCKNNNIKLLRIKYNENIENTLLSFLDI